LNIISSGSNFEREMKNERAIPQITGYFIKLLRKNIECAVRELDKLANNMLKIEWIIFSFIATCMGLVALDVNVIIYHNFTLSQLLVVIALSLKGINKSMALAKRQYKTGSI
jgi:hypothetical protein